MEGRWVLRSKKGYPGPATAQATGMGARPRLRSCQRREVRPEAPLLSWRVQCSAGNPGRPGDGGAIPGSGLAQLNGQSFWKDGDWAPPATPAFSRQPRSWGPDYPSEDPTAPCLSFPTDQTGICIYKVVLSRGWRLGVGRPQAGGQQGQRLSPGWETSRNQGSPPMRLSSLKETQTKHGLEFF